MARGWTEDGLVTCFQVTISGPGSEMVSPSHRVSMFDGHVAGKRSCRWPFRAIVLRCIVRLDDGVRTTLQSPDPGHHGLAVQQPPRYLCETNQSEATVAMSTQGLQHEDIHKVFTIPRSRAVLVMTSGLKIQFLLRLMSKAPWKQ